jgi:hypothetical protein
LELIVELRVIYNKVAVSVPDLFLFIIILIVELY